MRYRYKLTCFMSSEKNRFQNCLTVSNIQLGNVVLDNSFDIEPLIYGSMKNKIPELELDSPYQQEQYVTATSA